MQYKTHDGWDLESIEPLGDFETNYTELEQLIYELRNCKRTMSLIEMRDALRYLVDALSDSLNMIEDNDEVIEVQED